MNQGNTKELSSIENRGNSPYEEQQLPLRTTQVYKIGLGKIQEVGKTKKIQTKLKK